MSATSTKLLYSEIEAAQMLGISARTMFNMRQDKQVPHIRVRNRVMYSPAALAKWIEGKEQGVKK